MTEVKPRRELTSYVLNPVSGRITEGPRQVRGSGASAVGPARHAAPGEGGFARGLRPPQRAEAGYRCGSLSRGGGAALITERSAARHGTPGRLQSPQAGGKQNTRSWRGTSHSVLSHLASGRPPFADSLSYCRSRACTRAHPRALKGPL